MPQFCVSSIFPLKMRHFFVPRVRWQVQFDECSPCKLTWTLLLVCACFFACVTPVVTCYMVDSSSEHGGLLLGLHCLYWLQYSLNFFVYAARSEQFRRAYGDFLGRAWGAVR